jgi:acyl-CoA synthetase (AMP-forming)/AMP-acid ligase II
MDAASSRTLDMNSSLMFACADVVAVLVRCVCSPCVCCAAALTCSSRDDCYYGAVGTPLDCNFVKLVDVPDMEYFSSDFPQPRGEIWVHGPNVFQGYYKQPDGQHTRTHAQKQWGVRR